jgi:hypothetical protein
MLIGQSFCPHLEKKITASEQRLSKHDSMQAEGLAKLGWKHELLLTITS